MGNRYVNVLLLTMLCSVTILLLLELSWFYRGIPFRIELPSIFHEMIGLSGVLLPWQRRDPTLNIIILWGIQVAFFAMLIGRDILRVFRSRREAQRGDHPVSTSADTGDAIAPPSLSKVYAYSLFVFVGIHAVLGILALRGARWMFRAEANVWVMIGCFLYFVWAYGYTLQCKRLSKGGYLGMMLSLSAIFAYVLAAVIMTASV